MTSHQSKLTFYSNCYRPMSKLSLYNHDFLGQMRQQTDPLADEAVAAIYQHPSASHFRETIATLTTNDYAIPSGLPDAVTRFLEQSRHLPDWADERLLRRGHDFYARHAQDLLLMLGLLSLPYDYASAHGVQVLYLSERLRDNPGKRLAETGQYVLDVGSKDAFASKGRAISSAQKVRLIHAAIRYHLLQHDHRNAGHRNADHRDAGHWNPAWGQPVNQEDMAGTNLSMSLLPVRGMRKLGIRVEHDDMLAYIHRWNVASYLMGVDERLLPDTGKDAFWLSKMITDRQHHPSKAGQAMMKSLLNYLQENIPGSISQLAPAYMRFMLGDEVADMLAIPPARLPPSLVASPLKGLNALRNLAGYQTKSYYETRSRLQQEIKRQQADQFRAPERLGASG